MGRSKESSFKKDMAYGLTFMALLGVGANEGVKAYVGHHNQTDYEQALPECDDIDYGSMSRYHPKAIRKDGTLDMSELQKYAEDGNEMTQKNGFEDVPPLHAEDLVRTIGQTGVECIKPNGEIQQHYAVG